MRACRPWLARSCIFFTSAASWERSRLAWRSICHCISAWAGRRSAAKSGRERPAPRLKPDYRRLPMPRIAGAPARSRGGHAAYNGRALPLFRFNSMAIATDRNAAVMNILRFSDLCAQGKADRKSTRLNSSHTVISYAVFCLKKKKKTQHIRYSEEHYKFDVLIVRVFLTD